MVRTQKKTGVSDLQLLTTNSENEQSESNALGASRHQGPLSPANLAMRSMRRAQIELRDGGAAMRAMIRGASSSSGGLNAGSLASPLRNPPGYGSDGLPSPRTSGAKLLNKARKSGAATVAQMIMLDDNMPRMRPDRVARSNRAVAQARQSIGRSTASHDLDPLPAIAGRGRDCAVPPPEET